MCKSKMFVVAFVTYVACSLLVVPAAEARSTVAFEEENLKTSDNNNQYSLLQQHRLMIQDTIQGNMHRRFLADGDNKTVAGPNIPSMPAKSCKVVNLPKYEDNWNEVILKFNENDVSKECLHLKTFTDHYCVRKDGSTCLKKISEVPDLCTDTDVDSELRGIDGRCDSNTGKCSFASNSYWTNDNGKCAAEPVIIVMKNVCESKEIPETSTEVTLRDAYTFCEWGSDVANAVATILIVVIVVIVIAVLGGIACCCFCCSGCPGYKCCHKQQPPVMYAQPGVMMQPMQPGMQPMQPGMQPMQPGMQPMQPGMQPMQPGMSQGMPMPMQPMK